MRKVVASAADRRFFRAQLSKDEHPPCELTRKATLLKTCQDDATAEAEWEALHALAAAPGERLVPTPIRRDGARIEMEAIDGMRVFEAIWCLRDWARAEPDQPGAAALAVFMARLRTRLARVQPLLLESLSDDRPVYPFHDKVRATIEWLGRLLDVPPGRGEDAQWEALAGMWQAAATYPFRDATTKNMVIGDERLSLRGSRSWSQRCATLRQLVRDEPGFMAEVPIFDIDFASVIHRTAAPDDWVSLLLHECTAPLLPMPGYVAIASNTSDTDVVGLAVVVRYVRFGARKMGYQLISPAAARVRFARDDPSFYFQHLSGVLDSTAPGFGQEFPGVVARLTAIGAAYRNWVADGSVRAGPPPRDTADPRRYWRESPLEVTTHSGLPATHPGTGAGWGP